MIHALGNAFFLTIGEGRLHGLADVLTTFLHNGVNPRLCPEDALDDHWVAVGNVAQLVGQSQRGLMALSFLWDVAAYPAVHNLLHLHTFVLAVGDVEIPNFRTPNLLVLGTALALTIVFSEQLVVFRIFLSEHALCIEVEDVASLSGWSKRHAGCILATLVGLQTQQTAHLDGIVDEVAPFLAGFEYHLHSFFRRSDEDQIDTEILQLLGSPAREDVTGMLRQMVGVDDSQPVKMGRLLESPFGRYTILLRFSKVVGYEDDAWQ